MSTKNRSIASDSNHTDSADLAQRSNPREYAAPEVTCLGSFSDLTQIAGTVGATDGVTKTGT